MVVPFAEAGPGPEWWTLLSFYFYFFYFLITVNILKFRHELPELHITSAYRPKQLFKGISNWILLYLKEEDLVIIGNSHGTSLDHSGKPTILSPAVPVALSSVPSAAGIS